VAVPPDTNLPIIASYLRTVRSEDNVARIVLLNVLECWIIGQLKLFAFLLIAPFIFLLFFDLPNIEGSIFIEPIDVHLAVT